MQAFQKPLAQVGLLDAEYSGPPARSLFLPDGQVYAFEKRLAELLLVLPAESDRAKPEGFAMPAQEAVVSARPILPVVGFAPPFHPHFARDGHRRVKAGGAAQALGFLRAHVQPPAWRWHAPVEGRRQAAQALRFPRALVRAVMFSQLHFQADDRESWAAEFQAQRGLRVPASQLHFRKAQPVSGQRARAWLISSVKAPAMRPSSGVSRCVRAMGRT